MLARCNLVNSKGRKFRVNHKRECNYKTIKANLQKCFKSKISPSLEAYEAKVFL